MYIDKSYCKHRVDEDFNNLCVITTGTINKIVVRYPIYLLMPYGLISIKVYLLSFLVTPMKFFHGNYSLADKNYRLFMFMQLYAYQRAFV